jgi:hypothetical protein
MNAGLRSFCLSLVSVVAAAPCAAAEPTEKTAGGKIRTSKRRGNWAVFYDPELAVTFIFTAGDSADNGRMWVFKYGGKPANGAR